MDRRSYRVFRLITVLTLLNTVAFGVAVTMDHPWPAALRWLPLPIIIGMAAYLGRHVRANPDAPPSVHRYWQVSTAGLFVFFLTTAVRLVDAVGVGVSLVPLAVVTHIVGGILMTYPVLKLPLDPGGRSSKIGVRLDVGTLMIAAAVLILHFATLPLLRDGVLDLRDYLSAGVILVAGVGVVHTNAQIALTGVPWISRRALQSIGASGVIGGLGSTVGLLLPLGLNTSVLILLLPWAAWTFALSAKFQLEEPVGASAPRPRRGYSLMPYVAVASVCGMLIVTQVTNAPDRLFMVAFAVLIVVLVVIRQLIAFRRNDELLHQIGVQEKQFRALVQNSTDMVTIAGADGKIRYVSPAVRRILGIEPEELIDSGMMDRVHPDDRALPIASQQRIIGWPGATHTFEIRSRNADGTWRWLEVTTMNLLEDPAVNGLVSNSRDITETRMIQKQLSHETTHDALTGLANRSLFGGRLTAAVARTDSMTPFSIVLVDLDDFKIVNDTHGGIVGDALLVHVAAKLRGGVRPGDTVARLGGDEFAILFEDIGGDRAAEVLDRLAAALLEPAVVQGEPLSVKASFGMVDGVPGDDPDDLLRRADIAMHEAKELSEGGLQRYRPGMEARNADRRKITIELRTAIDDDQLVVHYQPLVTLPEGRITGVEALVRWQHPERGLLPPGAFVDIAEQTGLIVPLGRWVLRDATRRAVTWIGDPISLSVNASARQLRDPEFASDVAAALRDSGLPARRLTLEITESTAVGGGATQDTLERLRELGVRLSLDDFGTGASTLSLLATCPVDQIKLDRSFVPPPGTDAIAIAVLQLARAFGMEAIAEGVETAEQAEHLAALGYTRAQGYHFARPMPADQLGALLTDRLALG